MINNPDDVLDGNLGIGNVSRDWLLAKGAPSSLFLFGGESECSAVHVRDALRSDSGCVVLVPHDEPLVPGEALCFQVPGRARAQGLLVPPGEEEDLEALVQQRREQPEHGRDPRAGLLARPRLEGRRIVRPGKETFLLNHHRLIGGEMQERTGEAAAAARTRTA